MEAEVRVEDYPVTVRPLSKEDGGGWLAEIADLPGLIADGESPERAMEDAYSAAAAWLAHAREQGIAIPEPLSAGQYSGKWVQRVPKSLHAALARRAKREGVSLNALATALLAQGLGLKRSA